MEKVTLKRKNGKRKKQDISGLNIYFIMEHFFQFLHIIQI